MRIGNSGKTPPKQGRPSTIPDELPSALATHAIMLQVSGQGEATRTKMIIAAQALTVGTPWEDKNVPGIYGGELGQTAQQFCNL